MRLFNIIRNSITLIKYLPHYWLFTKSANRKTIEEDLESFAKHSGREGSRLRMLVILLASNPYYRKLFYLRLGKVSRYVKWYTREPDTFIINETAIGGGVYLAHPYATILNAKSIGRNFSVRQCTTIGNKEDGRNDLVPTIGDNVSLGANVCIIGDVVIGDNVVVGAGSVVTKDIPANSIAAGIPAKVIRTL